MRFFIQFVIVLFLTGCFDFAVQSLQRASDEVGGVEGVVKVGGDQLVKAEEIARWAYAANGGDAEAQYNMGKAFCCGKRPYYNTYDALKWFCMAAKQGQRDAMFEIGKIYEGVNEEEGSVIPQDDILAYVYYTKSAERGNKDAKEHKERKMSELGIDDRRTAKSILDSWPRIQCEIH